MSTIPSPVNGHDRHTGKVDEQPIPYVLTDAAEREPRIVPALINGAKVYIECPAWCVVDHTRRDVVFLEDVDHRGEEINLMAPRLGKRPEFLLHAQLRQDPFGTDAGQVETHMLVTDESEDFCMSPDQLEWFADNLVTFAAQLRKADRIAKGGAS